MHFVLLPPILEGTEGQQQREAAVRERFPLFADVAPLWMAAAAASHDDEGSRYALVCDTDHTALAVLRQDYPFRGGVVTVVALVVRELSGLHRLLRFLRRFLTEVAPCVRTLNLTPHALVVFKHEGVSVGDIDRTLQQHAFRRQATDDDEMLSSKKRANGTFLTSIPDSLRARS